MADDINSLLQQAGLLGPQASSNTQSGLLAALDPYGGASQLGLSLLANAGGSPYRKPLGQIIGQSALQSQQQAQQNALNQIAIAQGTVGLGSSIQKQQAINEWLKAQQAQGQPGQPQSGMPQSPQGGLPPPMLQMPGNGYDPRQPSTAAQAQQPQPSQAPQQGDLSQIPINGMDPNLYRRLAVLQGKDPLETDKEIRGLQLQTVQQAVSTKLQPLDEVVKSPDSAKIVSANPQLQQVWQQTAPALGMDPVKDFNDANVRGAFNMAGNQVRAQAQLPTQAAPVALRTVTLPDGRTAQIDPMTGKQTVEAASSLEKVIGPNGPTLVPTSKAAGMTPFNQSIFGAGNISDQQKDLAYQSYVANGGKLPAGMVPRSDAGKAQIFNYIADRAKQEGNTAVSITAQGQATQAAGAVVKAFTSGKESQQINSINTAVQHMTALTPLVDALNSGQIPLINKAKIAFKNATGQEAPNDYNALKNFVNGEVAKAVLPGGGGEREREELNAPFKNSNSPAQLKGALDVTVKALAGKTEALRNQWDVGTNGAQGSFDKFLLPATKKALGIEAAPAKLSDDALVKKWGG